ncbi:MAG: diadenylate cyclase CdaA [Thermodesulfovibrionales bacterium]|nr:diadenylate cyclase CdaA [Thermodesulfovibrionales bacterium]
MFSLYQIRWQDFIDILIIAFILYRLLAFFKRGSRAGRIVIGIVILLAASLLSKTFGFYTVDWLFHNFWSQIVIALIIIFQPEIRRALAQMGRSPIFGLTSAEEIKSIDEIVKAAISLASRKIGALIVIEREVSLRDYVEIGVPLDAKVSKELLLSIFHPTSPIHDGAVIIRGNRVVAAGCFLPLALGTEISKAYGTRHRAGIGLSEETDAVVIIISEETGHISVAIRGELKTNLDLSTLRDILTNLFSEKEEL